MMNISPAGARWLHHEKNKSPFDDNRDGFCRSRGGITRRLTPYGREVLKEARDAMRHKGWSLTRAIDYVKRHRVGAYVEI